MLLMRKATGLVKGKHPSEYVVFLYSDIKCSRLRNSAPNLSYQKHLSFSTGFDNGICDLGARTVHYLAHIAAEVHPPRKCGERIQHLRTRACTSATGAPVQPAL